MDDEWEELRRLALAASPGRWHTDPEYRGWIFDDGSYIATTHRGKDSLVEPNAAYIAAASPQQILRLLDLARVRWHTWNVLDKPVEC